MSKNGLSPQKASIYGIERGKGKIPEA